jgi:hypothetical protein
MKSQNNQRRQTFSKNTLASIELFAMYKNISVLIRLFATSKNSHVLIKTIGQNQPTLTYFKNPRHFLSSSLFSPSLPIPQYLALSLSALFA